MSSILQFLLFFSFSSVSSQALGPRCPEALCFLHEPPGGLSPSSEFSFTLNRPAPVKLSHPASPPSSSSPPAPLSPPSWPPQTHLDSQSAFSLHEGRGEAAGALDVDPLPLQLASPGNCRDLGQRASRDVSTLTGMLVVQCVIP